MSQISFGGSTVSRILFRFTLVAGFLDVMRAGFFLTLTVRFFVNCALDPIIVVRLRSRFAFGFDRAAGRATDRFFGLGVAILGLATDSVDAAAASFFFAVLFVDDAATSFFFADFFLVPIAPVALGFFDFAAVTVDVLFFFFGADYRVLKADPFTVFARSFFGPVRFAFDFFAAVVFFVAIPVLLPAAWRKTRLLNCSICCVCPERVLLHPPRSTDTQPIKLPRFRCPRNS